MTYFQVNHNVWRVQSYNWIELEVHGSVNMLAWFGAVENVRPTTPSVAVLDQEKEDKGEINKPYSFDM